MKFGDSDRFAVSRVPQEFDQTLLDYLQAELERIQTALEGTNQLDPYRHKPPPRPVNGMLAFAPGAPGWDPGQGAGFYGYVNGAWLKFHT